MRDTNAQAVPIFRIHRGIGMQVDAFVLGNHVHCCLQGLCTALRLDYQKAIRITRANIRISLTEAVIVRHGLELITHGIKPQDMQRWLDFRWRDGDQDSLVRLRDYWGTIWADFAEANLILPQDGFVGQEVVSDGVLSRIPRRHHILSASAAEKAASGRKGAEARWSDKGITPEKIRALFDLMATQSYASAAAHLLMATSTAYGITKGTYKLTGANQAAWDETFGGGKRHQPLSAVVVADTPAVVVSWSTVLTIHRLLKQGGTVEQVARRTGLSMDDIQNIVTGHFWPRKTDIPLVWHETFGQDAPGETQKQKDPAIKRV